MNLVNGYFLKATYLLPLPNYCLKLCDSEKTPWIITTHLHKLYLTFNQLKQPINTNWIPPRICSIKVNGHENTSINQWETTVIRHIFDDFHFTTTHIETFEGFFWCQWNTQSKMYKQFTLCFDHTAGWSCQTWWNSVAKIQDMSNHIGVLEVRSCVQETANQHRLVGSSKKKIMAWAWGDSRYPLDPLDT